MLLPKYTVTEDIDINARPRWLNPCTAEEIPYREDYPLDPTRSEEKETYDRITYRTLEAVDAIDDWKNEWVNKRAVNAYFIIQYLLVTLFLVILS